MKKLKICIVSPKAFPLLTNSDELPPGGGAEIQLVTLGKAFADQGHEICFLVDDFGQDPSIDISTRISVKKVPLRYMGGPNYYLPLDWIKLIYTLNNLKADVHLIKLPNHLLVPLGIFCRLFNKRLVFVCQTAWDGDLKYLKSHRSFFEFYLYRIGLHFTDHIVAQNQEQYKSITRISSSRVSVIRNLLTFSKTTECDSDRFVLWVGSNYSVKRPELFLQIARKCTDIPFKMIMTTSKKNFSETAIKNQCQEIPNLHYLGSVPFSRIRDFFEKCALVASTSAYEGFPNVFLQAWQCSKPVVSLEIDPDGVIGKKDLGRVSFSLEKMAQDIRDLIREDGLRHRLGANGKKYVVEYHNTEKIVDQYCNLFESLLTGSFSLPEDCGG